MPLHLMTYEMVIFSKTFDLLSARVRKDKVICMQMRHTQLVSFLGITCKITELVRANSNV